MKIPGLSSKRSQIRSIINKSLNDLEVKVINHSDPSYIDLQGIIIEDNANTIMIDDGDKQLLVPKEYSTLEFRIENLVFQLDGNLLLGSLKRRKKRKLRNW